MLRKTKKFIPFVLPALSIIAPASVFAQQLVPTGTEGFAGFPNVGIVDVMRNIIRFILIVAFIIAFIMLIVGGIRWMMAGGDEKAVEKARGTITSALIGMVVVLVSFALIKLVETFFGITITSTGNIQIPSVGTK
ncbi:hypothetical protein HYW40_00645 [Candidatus Curtissbacteria bacterium]|nr:hypothetical protein [Candidatus Curtissbacteria bacterium]